MHTSFSLTMSLFAFITTLYGLTTFQKRGSLMSILLLMVANYDFHVIFPQCTRQCCVRTLYQPMMSKHKTCAPCLYPSLVWTMLSFFIQQFSDRFLCSLHQFASAQGGTRTRMPRHMILSHDCIPLPALAHET